MRSATCMVFALVCCACDSGESEKSGTSTDAGNDVPGDDAGLADASSGKDAASDADASVDEGPPEMGGENGWPWTSGACSFWTRNPLLTRYWGVESADGQLWLTGDNSVLHQGADGQWSIALNPEELTPVGRVWEVASAFSDRLFVRAGGSGDVHERIEGGWQLQLQGVLELESSDDALLALLGDNSVQRYDGSEWSELLPAGPDVFTNLFWDGSRLFVSAEAGGLRAFDGVEWSTLGAPSFTPITSVAGNAVLGTFAANGELYTVGDQALEELEGPRCTAGANASTLGILAASSDALFVTGVCSSPGDRVLFRYDTAGWHELGKIPTSASRRIVDAEWTGGELVIVGDLGLFWRWDGASFLPMEVSVEGPPDGPMSGDPDGTLYVGRSKGGVVAVEPDGSWRVLRGTKSRAPTALVHNGSELFVASAGEAGETVLARYDAAASRFTDELRVTGTFPGIFPAMAASAAGAWATVTVTRLERHMVEVYRHDDGSWVLVDSVADCSLRPQLAVAGDDHVVLSCSDEVYELGADGFELLGSASPLNEGTVHQLGPAASPAILRSYSATQFYLDQGDGWTMLTLPAAGSLSIVGVPGTYVALGDAAEPFAVSDGNAWLPQSAGWFGRLYLYPAWDVRRRRVALASATSFAMRIGTGYGLDAEASVLMRCSLPAAD